MKTAREWVAEQVNCNSEADMAAALAARDAEHAVVLAEVRAEMKSWQERSIAIQKQEEEVEAERDGAVSDNFRLMTERDRLKGELTEAVKRAEALESLVDTERHERKETANTLFFVRKELQKMGGELVGALELLRTVATDSSPAMDAWDARCDEYLARHGGPSPAESTVAGARECRSAKSPPCAHCRGTGLRQPPAPPDYIRERLLQVEIDTRTNGDLIDRLARRLIGFDDAQKPVAPQEQAGHAFECDSPYAHKREHRDCICDVCEKPKADCTGAKP